MTEENKNLNVVDTNNNLDEPSNEYATTADEVHRFTVGFHRKQKSKKMIN